MEALETKIQKEKDQIFRRLAELHVEELRRRGVFEKTPHFSTLEGSAHQLAMEVSRVLQEQSAREVAAQGPPRAPCPECGRECDSTLVKRTVKSLDGPIELLEPKCHCSACRRAFFPSA